MTASVYLPQHFRHVQDGLCNSQLKNCPCPISLSKELGLKLSELAPSCAIGRIVLQVLLIQGTNPLNVSKLPFNLHGIVIGNPYLVARTASALTHALTDAHLKT